MGAPSPTGGDRNPYPPPPAPQPGPPAWFLRWWPVVLTIVGFVAGLTLLYLDVSHDGTVQPVPAVIYGTMMGYLPIAAVLAFLRK